MSFAIQRSLAVSLAFAAASIGMAAKAAEPLPQPTESVVFAEVGGRPLRLDLHLPPGDGPFPTVVWVHGGAWRSGSRSDVPAVGLTEHGYAVASVDYRLSVDERFPAQVHDIKAAIRYLRTHAARHRLDPARFAVAGSSAGGHLAALVGVSGGHDALEGDANNGGQVPSGVRAIVSFYGASNLQTILSQSTPHGLSVRVPALQLLLGGQPEQKAQLAWLASPIAHVDRNDPPLMLIHGDQDPQMPIEQSYELRDAYRAAGVDVELIVVAGGKHGGSEFFSKQRIDEVARFLDQHMPGRAVSE